MLWDVVAFSFLSNHKKFWTCIRLLVLIYRDARNAHVFHSDENNMDNLQIMRSSLDTHSVAITKETHNNTHLFLCSRDACHKDLDFSILILRFFFLIAHRFICLYCGVCSYHILQCILNWISSNLNFEKHFTLYLSHSYLLVQVHCDEYFIVWLLMLLLLLFLNNGKKTFVKEMNKSQSKPFCDFSHAKNLSLMLLKFSITAFLYYKIYSTYQRILHNSQLI